MSKLFKIDDTIQYWYKETQFVINHRVRQCFYNWYHGILSGQYVLPQQDGRIPFCFLFGRRKKINVWYILVAEEGIQVGEEWSHDSFTIFRFYDRYVEDGRQRTPTMVIRLHSMMWMKIFWRYKSCLFLLITLHGKNFHESVVLNNSQVYFT